MNANNKTDGTIKGTITRVSNITEYKGTYNIGFQVDKAKKWYNYSGSLESCEVHKSNAVVNKSTLSGGFNNTNNDMSKKLEIFKISPIEGKTDFKVDGLKTNLPSNSLDLYVKTWQELKATEVYEDCRKNGWDFNACVTSIFISRNK